MDWAGFTLAAPCAIITLNLILLPPDKRDPNKVLKAKDQVLTLLKILDNQLINNKFILGDEFSLADIPAGCWYNRCLKFDFDFSQFKGISNWELVCLKKNHIKMLFYQLLCLLTKYYVFFNQKGNSNYY